MAARAFLLLVAVSRVWAQAPGAIAGTVTDAVTHQPVRDAVVAVMAGAHDTTKDDGSYTIKDQPPGAVAIRIVADGYRELDAVADPAGAIHLAPGDFLKRDFELHPLAAVRGKVFDRDTGEPLTARVFAAQQEMLAGVPHLSIKRVSQSDGPAGEFELTDVEPGDYALALTRISTTGPAGPSASGYWNEAWYPGVPRFDMAATIHVSEGEHRIIDIRVPSVSSRYVGGVIEPPAGHENDPVELYLQQGGMAMAVLTTIRKSGPFRMRVFGPGTYGFAAKIGEGAGPRYGRAVFTVTDHDIDDLKISFQPAASVRATLRMAEEGVPLPASHAKEIFDQLMKAAAAGLPPPKSLPDLMGPTLTLIAAGGAGDIVQPYWDQGPGCSGWMCGPGSDMGGFPMVDGRASDIRPGPDAIQPFADIPQGRYWPVLRNLPDGYAILRILFNNQDLDSQPMVLSGSGDLTFVLTSKVGAIAGSVRDGSGAAVIHAGVVLVPDSFSGGSDPRLIRLTESGANGDFSLKNLAPGEYRMVVLAGAARINARDTGFVAGQMQNSEAVEVEPGQTKSVTLHL